jgi:hypothetical protein
MTEANVPDAIVRYELSKKIARITLARPPVNALTFEMVHAVVDSVKRAANDRQARVVMLSSAIAKCFSAGLDLDILIGESGEDIRKLLQELYAGLYDAHMNLANRPSQLSVARRAVVYDDGGFVRRHCRRRECHIRVSGGRRRANTGSPFRALAETYRSSSCIRAPIQWSNL